MFTSLVSVVVVLDDRQYTWLWVNTVYPPVNILFVNSGLVAMTHTNIYKCSVNIHLYIYIYSLIYRCLNFISVDHGLVLLVGETLTPATVSRTPDAASCAAGSSGCSPAMLARSSWRSRGSQSQLVDSMAHGLVDGCLGVNGGFLDGEKWPMIRFFAD